MKKLFLLCLLLHKLTQLDAQNDSTGFGREWDSMFSNFSPPTGYLWDKGMPDSSLWFFTGKPGDSSSDFSQLGNTYQYWINSSMNPSNNPVSYESMRDQLNSSFKQGITVIPLLHILADRIRKSALDSGLVSLDSASGKLIALNNIPFSTVRTVISAPFVPVFYDSIARLYFANAFYFTNTGTSISGIRIRLNNGAWTSVNLGVQQNILLTQKGINRLTIEYTLNNNEVYYTETSLVYADLPLGAVSPPPPTFQFGDGNGNIYATPVRTTETGEPSGAFIACVPGKTNGITNTNLRKPLIFVEGIDFGYKDHPTGCYGGKCGHLGLRDLVNGEVYNPYESNYKKWYEQWDAIKKAPKLIDELGKKGYDIIYLDFHNGADYIENNAMLLVELIKQVNSKKTTNEEIVIMASSMGGLVARYALSFMERNKIPHCTRTYLAFDSPHAGANIPLGMQYQMLYYKGKLPGVRDICDRKLSRAATKQLLLYHCMSGEQAAAHPWRKDFVDALYGLGNYPVFSRNIALINGSTTGGNQGYNPGVKLISINPYLGSAFDPAFLRWTSVVYACYLNLQDRGLVLEARFPFKKMEVAEVPISTRQLDHAPGGRRFDLKEARAIYIGFNVINHHDAACFIPSISALDVKTGNSFYDITQHIDKKNPDPSKYPFHTWYGPQGGNEEHSQITDGNIQWILDELEKNRVELPAVLSSVYNYGQFERFLFRGSSIVSGGKLQFNGNYKTGFGNGPYDQTPTPGSSFESYTTDCGSVMTIEAGGQMVVGDNNTAKNKAVVHLRKGSTLVIKANGVLKIYDHSQLIIEDGAKLVYYAGAKIILEGESAMLQLDGTLRLEANAVFAIDKGAAPTTGFLKYRNVGGGYGHASIEVVGNNTSINLNGTGKQTDHLLQVEGEMILPNLSPSTRLKELRISNCMVRYGNNSRIITHARINLSETKFENLSWAVANVSDALWINNPDNCTINACTFIGLNDGIRCTSNSSPVILTIENSVFDHCTQGFSSKGHGLNMRGNSFSNCLMRGLYIEAPANDSRILECQFRNNHEGMTVENTGMISRPVFVVTCTFHYNFSGLDVRQCQTTIACTQFINNLTGVSILHGELNISRSRVNAGSLYSSAGGNNTFAYNQFGLQLSGPVFFLDNGYNNFIQNGVPPYEFVKGDVAYSSLTHQWNMPYALNAANNYWQPAPGGSLMNGNMTHYMVMFPFPGGGMTMNYFSGSMLTGVNTICFQSPCNPCPNMVKDEKEFLSGVVSPGMVSISPYPVSDELKIELQLRATETQFRIRLINMEGKVMFESVEASPVIHISASEYAEGIYLLEVISNERSEVKKVLIRR